MSRGNKNDPEITASETVPVRLDRALLDGLNAYAAAEKDAPSHAEAIRRIVHDLLRAKGYLRTSEHEEGTRPQDLSSANDG